VAVDRSRSSGQEQGQGQEAGAVAGTDAECTEFNRGREFVKAAATDASLHLRMLRSSSRDNARP